MGNFRGQHFKVTSGFTKYLGNAAILNDYTNMLGEAGYFEDGGADGRDAGREKGDVGRPGGSGPCEAR